MQPQGLNRIPAAGPPSSRSPPFQRSSRLRTAYACGLHAMRGSATTLPAWVSCRWLHFDGGHRFTKAGIQG
jgi:hypothetical protein